MILKIISFLVLFFLKISSTNGQDFQPCSRHKIFQYYQVKVKPNYSSENLKSKINSLIENPTSENGYITYHFISNCHQEIGNVTIEEIDANYLRTTFSTKLKFMLEKFIKEEITFKIPNKNVVYSLFISFKIENGKVAQIIP